MSLLVALAGLAAQLSFLSAIGPDDEAGQAARRVAQPTVEFEVETLQVSERPGTISVRVELSAPARRNLAIPFTIGGTATRFEDYVVSSSPVVIPRGRKSASILVDILQDSDDDDDGETIELTLDPPPGGIVVGKFGRARLRVLNPQLGDPINGLTVAQVAAFHRGFKVFTRRFKPSEGLGPFYNATSCSSCHSTPVVGGGSGLYRNFYLAVYQFGPTPASQSSSIPPFLSAVVPAFGSGDEHAFTTDFTLEGGRPLMPDFIFGAFPVLSAQRNAIPVFGVGLFENVSDTTILSNADPFDLNGDGISGVANTQLNGAAVGRLGMKSQSNNIELFTRGPLQNQMGITSDPFEGSGGLVSMTCSPLFQVAADPNDPTEDVDPVADPEISSQDLGDLIAYGKFLAPPPPPTFTSSGERGKALFEAVGCTDCHIPSLPSSKGPVKAYTDLLLHDMGPVLADNILLGDATSSVNEFRTQPLWGISNFPPFLHDGRAATVMEAVLLHGGEAQSRVNAFNALSVGAQTDIINFLEQL